MNIDRELQGMMVDLNAPNVWDEGMSYACGDDYSNAGGCALKHPFNKGRRDACNKSHAENKASNKGTSTGTALSKGAFCVKGRPIYHPAAYLVTSRAKRTQNRAICRNRKLEKIADDTPPVEVVKDKPSEDFKAPTQDSTDSLGEQVSIGVNAPIGGKSSLGVNADGTKSKTNLYIGIGIGVVLLSVVGVVLYVKSKK